MPSSSGPALYVLAVGVSRYKDKDIPQLRYPGKDARDLAATLQRQRGTLYRETTVRVLADEMATRAQVMEGLDWLGKTVTKDDTAVVFLAGTAPMTSIAGTTTCPTMRAPEMTPCCPDRRS